MKVLSFFCALLLALSAEAAVKKMTSGQLNFTAIGSPGILKIRGTSNDKAPQGQVEIVNGEASGEFSFNLSGLDTGIGLRDDHMKNKYLEVEKYPEAKLKVSGLKLTPEEIATGVGRAFTGQLTLHGETKEVSGQFEIDKAGKLKASFPIKVSDFKIDVPKYMGITVSETVEVEVVGQVE